MAEVRAGGYVIRDGRWTLDVEDSPDADEPDLATLDEPGDVDEDDLDLTTLDEPRQDEERVEWPRHAGGGWWDLSDGTRMQGRDEANAAQDALDEEQE